MENRSDLANGDAPGGNTPGDNGPAGAAPRRRVRRAVLAGAGVLALALGGVWGARERIASDLIDRQLAALGLPARYHIDSVGLGREVISAVTVGAAGHPALTIERVEIALRYGLTGPEIDRLTLVRPRIYGRVEAGGLHFGSLDKVLYAPSTAPFKLPGWTLVLVDGRGRIDSQWGQLGLSADGTGPLADGFAGTMGLVVPDAHAGTGAQACHAARSTLFAAITTKKGRPMLSGPMRLGALDCAGTQMAAGRIDLDLAGDAALANWTIGGRLALGRIARGPQLTLAALGGEAGLRWDGARQALSGRITLDGRDLAAPALRLGGVRLDGVVHAGPGNGGIDIRGDLDGRGLARGPATVAALNAARGQLAGTPLAPLFDRATAALAREEPGSRLGGAIGLHADQAGWRVAVPGLILRGGHGAGSLGGQTLARVEQLAISGGDGRIPRLTGNFTTVGKDLPQISGTMMSGRGAGTSGRGAGSLGGAQFYLTLAPYSAGGAQLAVPGMAVSQMGDGSIGFSGTIALSGPFSGGRIDNLQLPVEGGLAGDGQLALLRRCVRPGFDRLRAGTLDLARASVMVCPVGGAIVRAGSGSVTVGAAVPALEFNGRAGDAPLALRTGAGRLVWPGTSSLANVDVTLGKGADASHARLASVTLDPAKATGGGSIASSIANSIGGSFAGGDVTMAALPASVGAAAGTWRLEGSRLTLAGGAFALSDRTLPARFAPVAARDVTMTLADGTVSAQARLVSPKVGADLARVALSHDISSGKGHADVTIDALTFRRATEKDKKPALQPADLTNLTTGLFALANGTIVGKARFDWNANAADGGLSGSGRFSSDDFDFAGDYGPVEGLSGTIEFTDLIHLVTAPHQRLKIASINPGIEVDNGVIDLDVHENEVVRLNRAEWPFEGGTLNLEPTELHFDVVEPRKFTLIVNGLAAGRFLQHINMSNLSATGTFDGRLPLVFDANGGRITGGRLVSRAPGGNVSYVGALSYRDLTPMANFAFKMLRSVDFRAMTIGLEGDLGGEVVTSVSFGGISQGKGAERNLVTRQLSRLPIRFDINVRSQFRHLMGTLSSLYDPSLVPDPRSLGLVDGQGRPLHHHGEATSGHQVPVPPLSNPLSPNSAPSNVFTPQPDRGGRAGRHAVLIAMTCLLGGCITVKAPDKPIVIELNVTIKQEVVYRLAGSLAALAPALLLLVAPQIAGAQARDPVYAAARAEGKVGEQVNGYLGFVVPAAPDLRKVIEDINIKRRAVYAEKAKTANATIEEYALTRPMAPGKPAGPGHRCAIRVAPDPARGMTPPPEYDWRIRLAHTTGAYGLRIRIANVFPPRACPPGTRVQLHKSGLA
eukprot:gene7818-7884_t